MNVLYVEDNSSDADLLKRTLSRTAPQITMEWVTTCKEALAKLEACSPDRPLYDLLLTDIELPDGEGPSLIPYLHEHNLPIAVVIITGMGSEEAAVAALKAGISDNVAKHADYLSRLPDILETALHRYRTEIVGHSRLLRVLYAEHNASDIDTTTLHFSRYAPHIHLEIVHSTDDVLKKMPSSERNGTDAQNICDVLLVDYHLPDMNAIGLLKELLEGRRLDLPIVIVAGHGDEESVIQAFRLGAMDYVVKRSSYLHQLPGVLENAFNKVQLAREQAALKENDEYYRSLIENTFDIIMVFDAESSTINYVSPSYERLLGHTPEEVMKTNSLNFVHPDDQQLIFDAMAETMRNLGSQGPTLELRTRHKDGSWRYMEGAGKGMLNKSGQAFVVVNLHDVTERKLAEQKIIESEQSLHAILMASPIGIGRVRNRVIDWINEAMCRMSGYTPEEVKGKSVRLFYESDEEYERAGKVLYTEGQVEANLKKKDGEVRYAFVQLSPTDSLSYIFTVTDMTQQKVAEKALRKSEVLYRTLVEKSSEIILLRDANHRRTYVSPNITKILGYSVEEFLSKDRASYIHPDSLPTRETARSWAMKHPSQPVTSIARILHKDGSWRWFECTERNLLEEPNVNAMVLNLQDITKRKEAEEALLESEAKYRMVVENSLVGFYIIQDNLFRFVNKRWCEIFGYTYEEAVNKISPIDNAYPDDRKTVEENIHKRMTGQEDNIEYEFRSLRKDGDVINVKVLGNSTMYNGRPAVTGTVIDITKEKTLESQLRQAQKMEAIGTLAGGVAHDFNNILTALTGYGTLLQLKLDKENPLRHYVDQILSASLKGANLTRSLLAFSRKQPITLKSVNLNNIVEGTEKLLRRLLTEDIILKTLLASDDIMLMADSTQIDQILFNLITNARDAMPKGGSLTVETKTVVLDKKFVTIHGFGKPGKYALLSISDTGTGMDATIKEHIFDPFFTTKEVGKGTGLGLSTTYGIVKQHNGYITVYSEPDIGTTVRIYLPLTGAVVEADTSSSESIRGGKEIILVAEDNKEVRHLIKNILVEFGYTIIEARDGEDAISKFNKHKNIDLLILDSVMPKKNGKAVYDEISATNPHIKAIFTSGYTRDIILDKGIEDNKFDFISKPLSPKELLKKVREALDRGKQ